VSTNVCPKLTFVVVLSALHLYACKQKDVRVFGVTNRATFGNLQSFFRRKPSRRGQFKEFETETQKEERSHARADL
jgi:hypothetical protein